MNTHSSSLRSNSHAATKVPGTLIEDASKVPGTLVEDAPKVPGTLIEDASKVPGTLVEDASKAPGIPRENAYGLDINEDAASPRQSGELTQAAAIRTMMEGSLAERARIGGRALRALLRDPEQTEMVFVLALAINRGRIGELLTQLVGTETGNWLLENRPTINSRAVDFDRLRALPEGTLGREYVDFLANNNLDADFFEEPPGLPPMIRYVAQRMRQTHDIWHTVTGYSTSPDGEVELQAFTYAQVGVPSAGLIALTGSIRGMREQLNMPLRALRAYRRGRRAEKFAPMIWENHWERPISALRAELRCD